MDDTTKWLLTFIFSVVVFAAGFSRYLTGMITRGHEQLHHRINQVRDEYVKRAELEAHMIRIDTRMRDMREEMRSDAKDLKSELKGVNGRLDAILPHLQIRKD